MTAMACFAKTRWLAIALRRPAGPVPRPLDCPGASRAQPQLANELKHGIRVLPARRGVDPPDGRTATNARPGLTRGAVQAYDRCMAALPWNLRETCGATPTGFPGGRRPGTASRRRSARFPQVPRQGGHAPVVGLDCTSCEPRSSISRRPPVWWVDAAPRGQDADAVFQLVGQLRLGT